MIDVIPAHTEELETWLIDSSGNIAASGAGIALLEAEIAPLSGVEQFNSPNEFRPQG